MHEVYRNLKHGTLYELLEQYYIELLNSVRNNKYNLAKIFREKITQLEELLA